MNDTALTVPALAELGEIYELLPGMTKSEAYTFHNNQMVIALQDIKDARTRARYNAYMIYRHGLWRTIMDTTTMLPAYNSFADWVRDHDMLGMSTARKYISQMKMLKAANYTDITHMDSEVIEELWRNAKTVDATTGEVLEFKYQPKGVSAKDIIHRSLDELSYDPDEQNVPPLLKRDAMHQLINPLEPRIWVERVGEDGFKMAWHKVTYPNGGDELPDKLSGSFTIMFNGQPPGDVVATVMKLLKVFK